MARPIVLVGLMGAGKTTIGRRLAERLKLKFIDSDEEIERAAGLTVADIFETYGEAGFRDGERRVIARLMGEAPHVLATGGGAFMNPATRALIKQNAVSVWLKADLDVLVERTSRRNTRPLLRAGDPAEILAKLMAERSPTYAQADVTVDSARHPHDHTVKLLIHSLQGCDMLRQARDMTTAMSSSQSDDHTPIDRADQSTHQRQGDPE